MCEALFEPQVVEPAHGDEVAEPLVARLMQHENVAAEVVAFGGCSAEEDAVFVEEGGPGMLHAAEGKARDQNEVVLGKRETAARSSRRNT